MLTNLRFKNFKAWQDSGNVRLAPLTVFFGNNSAGKTSIAQLLLLLKQSAASTDTTKPFHFGDARTLVDLGTYYDIAWGHQVKTPIEIEFHWTLDGDLYLRDHLSSSRFKGNSIAFSLKTEADQQGQPFVSFFQYSLEGVKKPELEISMAWNPQKKAYQLSTKDLKLVHRPGRVWPLKQVISFYNFPDEARAYYQNAAFLGRFAYELEFLFKRIYYVGPLRDYPKRLYPWSGDAPDHVGVKGDRAIEAILASSGRSFNLKQKQKNKNLQELVAERLRAMKLISDFSVKRLETHKIYEVLVRTHPKLPEVKLTDVGFGVSQVLPVIVESFFVPRRSIVIFEQPEIHLHPQVQAELADLFVDAIRAREGGQQRDCQFIIESHSEHFLRRLQLRLAQEELSPDDAALYFVDLKNESARLQELNIDLYGNISNWPDGFFGDEMGDLVARSEAQAKRMGKGERK